jgi:hypothetical protein
MRIHKRENRILPCKLTKDELIERGQSLAATIEDINTETDAQEGLKREMKARIGVLEAQRSSLAAVVSRRHELRDVSVEVQLHDDTNTVATVRMDTGEVIHSRTMNDDERQESLPLEA